MALFRPLPTVKASSDNWLLLVTARHILHCASAVSGMSIKAKAVNPNKHSNPRCALRLSSEYALAAVVCLPVFIRTDNTVKSSGKLLHP